jgi:alkanesulfonate monooxygenase SsuD/methylene tetrahydromethanopterin reductase-like flavin-dependent oxidoreductase (luciferase family)
VPTFWPYKHLDDGIALLREGAKEAGRDVASIEVAGFVAVIPLDDVDMARSLIKPLVSFYIGGMGAYYHAMFCRYGFKETADSVRDLYNAGDRRKAAAAVSDELIDAIAICGSVGHCRDKLAEWRGYGLGTALVNLPSGVPEEINQQVIRDLAPGR